VPTSSPGGKAAWKSRHQQGAGGTASRGGKGRSQCTHPPTHPRRQRPWCPRRGPPQAPRTPRRRRWCLCWPPLAGPRRWPRGGGRAGPGSGARGSHGPPPARQRGGGGGGAGREGRLGHPCLSRGGSCPIRRATGTLGVRQASIGGGGGSWLLTSHSVLCTSASLIRAPSSPGGSWPTARCSSAIPALWSAGSPRLPPARADSRALRPEARPRWGGRLLLDCAQGQAPRCHRLRPHLRMSITSTNPV